MLVRGKLDTPTWAYKEEMECEKSMRETREKLRATNEATDIAEGEDNGEGGEAKHETVDELREMVEIQPWLSIVEGGAKSAKARKVRRDIRYRPTSEIG